MTRQPVEQNVNLSLQSVDLLRFHRWGYGEASYPKARQRPSLLRNESKSRQLGLAKFFTSARRCRRVHYCFALS